MNILFLSQTDPADASFGGAQRTHLIHQSLCRHGRVYTLLPTFREELQTLDEEYRMARIYLERRWSPRWMARNLVCRVVPWIQLPSSRPFVLPRAWADVHMDLVVVRHADLAAYFHAWKMAPMLLDLDDFPMDLMDTQGRFRVQRLVRPLVSAWFRRIARHAACITVSHEGQCARLPSERPCVVLPNIPSDRPKRVDTSSEAAGDFLLTVGVMSHPPNIKGVTRFLNEIWPQIHQVYPSLAYRIAGGGCPADVRQTWEAVRGVEVLGFVKDLAPLYGYARAVVAPVETGSGTCIKVREALAWGRVCLAPSFGFRGIPQADITPENGMFCYRTASDVLSALHSLEEVVWREKCQENARQFAAAHWSREAFDVALDDAIFRTRDTSSEQVK